MKENYPAEPQYLEEEYEEIDLAGLARKLLREWKLVLKWCCVAAVVGLVIAFSIPREYSVTSELAPETVAKSSGGSLGSLASLAGINLSSMSTSDAVNPDIYPDIVSSTPFVVELFPVQVEFRDKKSVATADYYTYLKDFTRKPWWGYVFEAPSQALTWIRSLFREKDKTEDAAAVPDPKNLSLKQARIADRVRENVGLSVDKKTSVIALTVKAQDPRVATRISDEVIARLKKYVTSYRTEKARQDLAYYETLYNESKEAYYTAQQRYANYVDRNQGVVLQRVLTERERLENEMNLNFQLYNACAQQLQTAKAKVQQETPVFTVINPPQVPVKPSKPSKATILMGCIFLGAVLAVLWVLWIRDFLTGIKTGREDEETPAAPDQS